jgi:AhpD family alkylhydroperoxidase
LVADQNVQPAMLDLCFDPQTSGGLLIAVPAAVAGDLLARLHAAGVAEAAVIGKVVGTGSGRVFLHTRAKGDSPIFAETKIGTVPPIPSPSNLEQQSPAREASAMACCDPNHQSDHSPSGAGGGATDTAGGATAAERKFQEFLQAAGAPGALDAKTKQAIAIALSVLARCEPCVKSHVKKARAMGFLQEEIDEAAWMAIGFGGSPTMVFYNTNRLK